MNNKTMFNRYIIRRICISTAICVMLVIASAPIASISSILSENSDSTAIVYAAAKKITIKFNPTGGTTSTKSKKVVVGKKYGKLPTPNKSGYTFKGWFSKKSGGKKITSKSKVTSGVKRLFAKWEGEKFTVTFNGNTGTVATLSKVVINGGKYGVLPQGTKLEYELIGWYTEIVGGVKITQDTIVNLSEDTTLYAHWIVKPLKSLYDFNYFTKNGDWFRHSSFKDNEERIHKGWCIGNLPKPQDNVVFLLDSRYTVLNGTISLRYDYRNTGKSVSVNIYCDNTLVYSSPMITQGVRPISFSVDLRNVERLKFEIGSVLASGEIGIGIEANLNQL